jgi:hypothetical protein
MFLPVFSLCAFDSANLFLFMIPFSFLAITVTLK